MKYHQHGLSWRVCPRTLQNWEQGRRYPTGPAATLIRILDAHPSLI